MSRVATWPLGGSYVRAGRLTRGATAVETARWVLTAPDGRNVTYKEGLLLCTRAVFRSMMYPTVHYNTSSNYLRSIGTVTPTFIRSVRMSTSPSFSYTTMCPPLLLPLLQYRTRKTPQEMHSTHRQRVGLASLHSAFLLFSHRPNVMFHRKQELVSRSFFLKRM